MTAGQGNRVESSSAAPTGVTGGPAFYRYRTADGRTVIVDSISKVPGADRARAERVEFVQGAPSARESVVAQLDWPSFAAGFGLALVVGVVLNALFRGSSRMVGGLLLIGLVVAGSGAYLGLLRRGTGQGEALFASPTQVIDDAKQAVEKMKKAQNQQDQTIREIQKEAP